VAVSLLSGTGCVPDTVRTEVIEDRIRIQSIEVPSGDLDLSEAAGRATLHERIETAARHVCTLANEDFRDRDARRDRKRCIEETVSTATASITSNRY
jgi:UrcA family protein